MAKKRTKPRPQPAKSKLTISIAKKLIDQYLELRDNGQITLECNDARDFDRELRNIIKASKKCSECKLEITLLDYVLPHGQDPGDDESYNMLITDVDGNVLYDGVPDCCTYTHNE